MFASFSGLWGHFHGLCASGDSLGVCTEHFVGAGVVIPYEHVRGAVADVQHVLLDPRLEGVAPAAGPAAHPSRQEAAHDGQVQPGASRDPQASERLPPGLRLHHRARAGLLRGHRHGRAAHQQGQ